jgi:hypothetical protein
MCEKRQVPEMQLLVYSMMSATRSAFETCSEVYRKALGIPPLRPKSGFASMLALPSLGTIK